MTIKDFVKSKNGDATTRIVICWRGIYKANLRLDAGDVYGITLRKFDDRIETEFTNYPWGFDGAIVAEEIEVLNVEERATAQDRLSESLTQISFTFE